MSADNHEEAGRRQTVHFAVSAGVGVLILVFHAVNDTSVIAALFKVASYTYGPLLGLFAFALLRRNHGPTGGDRFIPWVSVLAPLMGWGLEQWTSAHGFSFGFALLPVNGFLTWAGATLAVLLAGNRKGAV